MSKFGIAPYKSKSTSPAPVKVSPEEIGRLQHDREQLQAVVRLLNLYGIGDTEVAPSVRVQMLIGSREDLRGAVVKLIARKTPALQDSI